MSDKYTIQKTSPQVREAIRRNTAAALPDRPSAMGMKPHEIRAAFFKAIISENGEGSLMDELDRIVDEFNEVQHNITSEVQLSTLTIPKSEWEDGDPKQALGTVNGLFAFSDTTASRKASILLLPVDNATRVESRSIGIEVTNVTPMTGTGTVTIFFSREGEAPAMDLKYVVIAFSEPNETGEAFAVSAGFIGIGTSSTEPEEKPKPSTIDLSRLDPDDTGKGYIVETYPDGSVEETELTYTDGKITKIKDSDGNETVLTW